MQDTAANRRLVHEILATAKEINRKAGRKISFACAEGLDGDWQVVEATEEPEVPVTPGTKEDPTESQNPSIGITKTANVTSGVMQGGVVTYTITVTNKGNVTLSTVS